MFEKAKALVLLEAVLVYYLAYYSTCLFTDASNGIVTSIIEQEQLDSTWHPMAYFSKTMDLAQINYKIYDKEMLAVMKALEEWWGHLIGLQTTLFTVYTNHRALEYFTTKRLLN